MKYQKGFLATLFVLATLFTSSSLASVPLFSLVDSYDNAVNEDRIPLEVEDASFIFDDINGDSFPDLIILPTTGQGQYFINSQTAENPFKDVIGTPFGDQGVVYASGLVAKIDGDDHPDLVLVVSGGVNKVFINNGSAEPFKDVVGLDIGSESNLTNSVAAGDINGDGDIDILTGNAGVQSNYYYLNNGTADPFKDATANAITSKDYLTVDTSLDSMNTSRFDIIDFNDDLLLDLFVVNTTSKGYREGVLYFNNGTETPFYKTEKLWFDVGDTQDIQVGDLDGDGDFDVVTVENKGVSVYSLVTIQYHDDKPPTYKLTSDALPVSEDRDAIFAKLIDMNKDDLIDIVVFSKSSNGSGNITAQLFLNDGEEQPFSGSKGIDIVTSLPNFGSSFMIGDIENDGDKDFVVLVQEGVKQFINTLVVDTTPPSISTEIFNNAVLLQPSRYQKINWWVSARDNIGVDNIAYKRSYSYDNELFTLGPEGVWQGPWYELNFQVSEPIFYKVELTATDKSGNKTELVVNFQVVSDPLLVDSDGDGMVDHWEVEQGFNKLNPLDAAEDKDEDDLTNLEEYLAKTNPLMKDSDFDGYSDFEEITNGTDPALKNYKPMAELPLDRFVGEGTEVLIDVLLSFEASVYPVRIELEIDGSSTAQEDKDFKLSTKELVITEGKKASFKLTAFDDALSEGRESIVLVLKNYTHAISGVRDQITFTIVEENIAPISNITATQNSRISRIVAMEQGTVTVSVNTSDVNTQDTHIVDWNFDAELGVVNISADSQSASFEPLGLEKGIYTIEAVVTDNGTPNLQVKTSIDIKVIEEVKSESEVLDDDDNGIPNAFDRVTESHQLAARGGAGLVGLLSTSPGLKLSIGSTALAGNGRDGQVDFAEIEAYMADKTTHSLIDEIENIGGYYDFDVSGLPFPGMTVDIVIPLSAEIPKGGIYRKFNPLTGWSNFVENSTNRIGSAKSVNGVCPPAGSEWYNFGLHAYAECVQLSIEDGGPNDMDGIANGVIKDPGGIAIQPEPVEVEAEEEEAETAASGSSGGGGSTDWFILLVMLFGGLSRICRFAR